ncbi:MAG: sulfotransferase [Kiritimatiellae bacterium]|nr:sulfotransferase [Kiritimatiellia bacterium]
MVTIVSGLPRSGTSLMMQMLAAGGMPILTDNVRQPDEDNPRGYFELERVKNTSIDPSWVEEAEGKAVKVVSMLLYELPPHHRYKVIFMTRRMEEILASQADMLKRRGITEDRPAGPEMRRFFEAHLRKLERWLAGQPHIEWVTCSYHALLEHPLREATAVARFLGRDLDVASMARCVDLALYRHRRET